MQDSEILSPELSEEMDESDTDRDSIPIDRTGYYGLNWLIIKKIKLKIKNIKYKILTKSIII